VPEFPEVRKTIVYIDGYNLYDGLRDRFGRKYLWLDLNQFCHMSPAPEPGMGVW
jgi:hypothetical protein